MSVADELSSGHWGGVQTNTLPRTGTPSNVNSPGLSAADSRRNAVEVSGSGGVFGGHKVLWTGSG